MDKEILITIKNSLIHFECKCQESKIDLNYIKVGLSQMY
jgi:hypothetical protein